VRADSTSVERSILILSQKTAAVPDSRRCPWSLSLLVANDVETEFVMENGE
jgi:hypothetical protein